MSVSHFCFRPYLFVVLVQPAFAPQLFKFESLPRDDETSSLPTIHKTNHEKYMNKNSVVPLQNKTPRNLRNLDGQFPSCFYFVFFKEKIDGETFKFIEEAASATESQISTNVNRTGL